APGVSASSSVQPTDAPPATTFVPIDPTRIVDSRDGSGLSGLKGQFKAGVARTFEVAGLGPISSSAVAVTGNVTVTGQTAAGYVAVTTDPEAQPTTSTINFVLGDTRANDVTISLSATGSLSATYVAMAGMTTSLIFDVDGYFVADDSGATFHPANARIIDSRTGAGQPNFGIDGGQPTKFKAGVPQIFSYAADEDCDVPSARPPCTDPALTGNLTVTNQTAAGYLAITPQRMTHPSISNLNFPVGQNRSNGVTFEFGGGKPLWIVYVAPAGATTDVILDMTGYYTPDLTGLHYFPMSPSRLIDSRSAASQYQLHGPFLASQPRQVTVGGELGIPADAQAVTGNLTVTGQTAAGHVAITTDSETAPATSTTNFPATGNWANGVLVPLGTGGIAGGTAFWLVYKGPAHQSTQIVFDVTGYFN
ncbi:MAG TPA: hypothetical protein VKR24_13275, partial [Candidatus Limnocylindrales bacterium]|nr:hypothetical protein [Candidatus Limnocylindrales bacterium]